MQKVLERQALGLARKGEAPVELLCYQRVTQWLAWIFTTRQKHSRVFLLLVECKWGDDGIVRGLSYLKERFAAAEKTQKTPADEIKLARRRQKEVTSS